MNSSSITSSIYPIDLFSQSNDITWLTELPINSTTSPIGCQQEANKHIFANYIQALNQGNAEHSDSMMDDGIDGLDIPLTDSIVVPADFGHLKYQSINRGMIRLLNIMIVIDDQDDEDD